LACRGEAATTPLQPENAVTWLVVRNELGRAVEVTELVPNVNPRKVLEAEREARIAAVWSAEPIGKACGFFFFARDGLRLCAGTEVCAPRGPVDPLTHVAGS
jgi:hypothetical protein